MASAHQYKRNRKSLAIVGAEVGDSLEVWLYLLPKTDVTEQAKALAAPMECDDYLQERSRLLDWRLHRFANALRHDRLQGVVLQKGILHVSPTQAITPPEADRLDRDLGRLMPRVRITELLNEVARRTGFAHAFTYLRSGKPVENETALLAAILADGSNLGLERMANASQGVTKAQLAWVHTWYLREETYKAALAAIIDAHHAEPMATIWGAGETSSSDGQFFRAGRRGHGSGEINAKYGIDPGMLFYQDKRNVDKRGSAKGVVDIATERSIRSGVQSFTALEEAIERKKAD